MTTPGPDTSVKPLLLRPHVLVGLALVGGLLTPVVFMALTATTLVLLVVLKLWTAQRLLRSGSA